MIYKFRGLDETDFRNKMSVDFSFNIRNDIHMIKDFSCNLIFFIHGNEKMAVFNNSRDRNEAFEELDLLLSFHPQIHSEMHI